MSHYRAEILTIFGSYFGRNDDFIKSFWNLLTFNGKSYILLYLETRRIMFNVVVFSLWPFNKTIKQTSFGLNLFFAQTWRSWHQLSFLTSPQKLSLRFFSFPTKPTLNCHKNVVWRCAKKTKEPEQHISLCNGSKIIECLKFKHSIIFQQTQKISRVYVVIVYWLAKVAVKFQVNFSKLIL